MSQKKINKMWGVELIVDTQVCNRLLIDAKSVEIVNIHTLKIDNAIIYLPEDDDLLFGDVDEPETS